jgi:RNA polymerase sigma-70 factor (ECF subfamily)
MRINEGDVTLLLRRWRDGDRPSGERLFEIILPELRRMARAYMSRERRDHTFEPTDLVDQIYFRLVAAKDRDWQSRSHFFAIAARAMRHCLIDYARSRPDAVFVGLDDLAQGAPGHPSKIELAVMVDRLLDELAQTHPQWCAVIELKFFLGLTNDESAEVLHLTDRTMGRYWHDARRWLFERLQGQPEP